MRKILALVLAVSASVLVGCKSETPGEKVERKLRNAGDDVKDAVDDLKD